MTKNFYRDAVGVILVYDITKHISFDSIREWIREIKEFANEDIVLLIVGNKSDLNHLREVKKEDGTLLALELKCALIETSALDSKNVERAFDSIIEEIYKLVISIDGKDDDCSMKVKQAVKGLGIK